jgi:hypothetical protein
MYRNFIKLGIAAVVILSGAKIFYAQEKSTGIYNDPDERDEFEANFYVGLAIDTFAGETRSYLNPEASGKVHERGVFGFNFAYRLWNHAKSNSMSASDRWRQQTWIYGETVHGSRSAELDCKAHPDVLICSESFAVTTNPLNDGVYLLRNATSLEAFMGVRHEFLGLNIGSRHSARAYIKGQVGFLTVARNVDDVVDLHHGAIGLLATKGDFRRSYLEIGLGRSDLFRVNRRKRIKIDGQLSRDIGGGVSFFARMTVDVDGGSGGDSIQSYIGFDFDMSDFALFKLGKLFSN